MQRSVLAPVIATLPAPVEIIEDVVSGRKTERPTYQKVLGWVKAGWVREIVCYRYDRIGRCAYEALQLADACRRAKTDIWSVGDGQRLLSPGGELMYGLLALLAQREAEVSAERTRDGVATAKAAGKIVGMTGLRYVRESTIRLAPTVYQYHDDGWSIDAICTRLRINRKTYRKIMAARETGLVSVQDALATVPPEKRGKRYHGLDR